MSTCSDVIQNNPFLDSPKISFYVYQSTELNELFLDILCAINVVQLVAFQCQFL